jgi:hypothetical protein
VDVGYKGCMLRVIWVILIIRFRGYRFISVRVDNLWMMGYRSKMFIWSIR